MDGAELSGRKILITGASGFIGSSLRRRLCRSRADVHVICRRRPENVEPGVTWWLGNLSEIELVTAHLKAIKPDIIFHLAGNSFASRDLALVMPTFRDNLMGTINLLTVATEVGCHRLITLGSMEEPGLTCNASAPSSPYAASKWASSAYARMFHAIYRLPIVILRLFMVYGPGTQSLQKIIPYVILSLLHGEGPKLASGKRQVDWVYIDDVVDGLLAAALAKGAAEGQTIDVGSGKMNSIRTVVEHLVQLVNPAIAPDFNSIPERPLEQIREADIARSYTLMGWKPAIPLELGLKKTVDWFRQNLENIDKGRRVIHPGSASADQKIAGQPWRD